MDTSFQNSSDLETKGYYIIKNLLDHKFIEEIINIYLQDAQNNKFIKGDDQTFNSLVVYNYPIFLTLLHSMKDRISVLCNKKLVPTYSYSRIYVHGEELDIHTDREACEYSVSINLYQDCEWALNIHNKFTNQFNSIVLYPGDAVIYKGIEQLHYRDKYHGQIYIQVFLHYVDNDGLYKDHKYDQIETINDRNIYSIIESIKMKL